MKVQKVLQSHHLQSAHYDPSTQELTITFVNGSSEVRTMVPRAVANGLERASSPGRYFHANINNVYPKKLTNATNTV